MFAQFKVYVAAGLLAMVTLLGAYCYYLSQKVDDLTDVNSSLKIIAEEKQSALQKCSDSVKVFREQEEEKTRLAKEALEEAKKEADEWREKAKNTSKKKPKDVVITDTNWSQFGGNNVMVQLKDYLATHQLMNEDIDEKDGK